MKYSKYLLAILCLVIANVVTAQDESDSKFKFIAYGGIGYGIVNNDDEADYNLNSNTAELLLYYKFNEKYGVATGVGLNELTGNGFSTLGEFYHQRDFIKIPLLFTYDYGFSDTFKVYGNLGPYAQGIIKDEYRFVDTVVEDVFEGWNFGFQLSLGLLFQVSDRFSTGINFTGQSDFTKLESNSGSGLEDKQRMRNLNTFGLLFMFDL
ncbi:outer membrane beta-barrel protein [Winogradskyella alexanderae]|uniref:Porin family protein n=1 Tax=Winogradskyella alexanderae TaxID=2877123 RepID=A0ABS7XQU0_9FLAO|nr:outer membrane beta-barrel protein [Winogradskyella alexanderae]MCA0132135.1 porin family protein [Winogradskyella alexanderae]